MPATTHPRALGALVVAFAGVLLLTVLLTARPATADRDVELDGRLIVGHLDYEDGREAEPFYALERSDGRHVDLNLGRRVEVSGEGVDEDRAPTEELERLAGAEVRVLASGPVVDEADVEEVTVTSEPEALEPADGEERLLVILAKFENDASEIMTRDEARSRVFTGQTSASAYFRSATGGKVSFTGDVTPWITLPFEPGDCTGDFARTTDRAIAEARDLEFDAADYDRRLIILNAPTGCSFAGRGELGGKTAWSLTASRQTIAHELGHLLGLHHTSLRRCRVDGTRVGAQPNADCENVEYGDHLSTMGNIGYHLLNGAHQQMLGAMAPSRVQQVATEGTYTIARGEAEAAARGRARLRRIPLTDDLAYLVEARPRIAPFDAFAAADPVGTGVTVHRVGSIEPFERYEPGPTTALVTTSVNTLTWPVRAADQPAAPIRPGRAFFDPVHRVTIEVTSSDTASATVRVLRGPKPNSSAQVLLAGGRLTVRDPVGRANDIAVSVTDDTVRVIDNAGPVSVTPGCLGVSRSQVECPRSTVQLVRLDLREGDDAVRTPAGLPVEVFGGAGDDAILLAGGPTEFVDAGSGDDVIGRLPGVGGSTVLHCGSGEDRYEETRPGASIAADCEAQHVAEVYVSTTSFGSEALRVRGTSAPERLSVSETTDGTHRVTSDRAFRAGPGCLQITDTVASCRGELDEIVMSGESGNDTLASASSVRSDLDGGAGDDELRTGTSSDIVTGGDGTDTVTYADRATPVLIEADRGGAEHGRERDELRGVEVIVGGGADDELTAVGGQTLVGGPGDDVLEGGTGADTLRGDAGDDVLIADDGARDELDCGAGTDRYVADAVDELTGCEQGLAGSASVVGSTLVVESGPPRSDKVFIAATAASYVVLNTSTPIVAGASCAQVTPTRVDCPRSAVSRADVRTGALADTVTVQTDLPTRIDGGPGDDVLVGGPAADTLLGGGGHDSLDGGAGPDRLRGGTGNDTVTYARRTAAVTAQADGRANDGEAGEGDDIHDDVEHLTGGIGDDRLIGAGTLTGRHGDDVLIGTAAAQTIDGGDGDDVLTGHGGADTIVAGPGDDLIRPRDGNAPDVIQGGPGRDTVTYDGAVAITADLAKPHDHVVEGSATAPASASGDTLIDTEVLVGSRLPDTLRGSDGADHLLGGAGNDVLSGGGGDDRLEGGDGTDSIDGGAGDDVIEPGDLAGVVDGGDGTDTVSWATVTEPLDIDLIRDPLVRRRTGLTGGSVMTTAIERVVGSAAADLIRGTAGPDRLDGAGGDDVIEGRGGDDLLRGGEGDDVLTGDAGDDTLEGGAGTDTVDRLGAPGPVRLTPDGIADDGVIGVERDNILPDVETLLGGEHDDILGSGPGANALDGRGGSNTLVFAGLASGAGVRVDLSVRGPQDAAAAGLDTYARIHNVVGTPANDVLRGNTSPNVLRPGTGDDVLVGGGHRDVVDYADATGPVTVDLRRTDAQPTGVMGRDALTGIHDVIGSAHADTITGSDGSNFLTGGGGADVIHGLGGIDRIFVRDGLSDTVTCGAGADTVEADRPPLDPLGSDCETVQRG